MILLVEDEDDDAFLMEIAMRKIPAAPRMTRVINGQQAIDYLKGEGKYADRTAYSLPKLIFLDLKLPFVHGFEVLKWIKAQPALNDVHVAVLTGSLVEADREKALTQGANSFHVKPPGRELLEKLFGAVFG
jgi:CheY-like chemotaxis protein